MAKPARIIVTILILLLVTALAAAAGYWSYVVQQWPWWIALAMAMGVFGLYFLFLFLKKYLIRRREKKFVQRIVDQGEVLSEEARPEQLAVQELEKSWKENISLLKTSHLQKKGNPLYVLPWYLAMGESGVGKTTMLANAGVASSFTEVEDGQGHIEPTRNCDWIFFNNSVILDTAGRYSVPLASTQGQGEWKRFLLLLAKYRRKEPLNGIILFVAADDLVKKKPIELKKKGQVLRNRIHSLMRTIGFKIPVCIMVTRMDTIPGFTEFAALLPETSREQVMGQVNSEETPYWKELLDKTLNTLDQGLQRIRLSEVARPEGRKAAFFSLPSQLIPLQHGLECFLDALFTENNYQETPALQGIFLGSGLSSQSPAPAFLSPEKESSQQQPQLGSAVFAKDFFTTVLPANRWNIEPVKELLLWKKVTHNLAAITFLCVITFAAGLVGLSYLHNQKVHSLFPTAVESISSKEPGSNTVIISLEKMRLAILEIEKANKAWKLPFIIFNNSQEEEAAYKERFCRLFVSSLIDPMEVGFEKRIDNVSSTTSADLYADYSAYSVEQISNLKNYLAGKKTVEFNSFSKVASAVLSIKNKNLISEVGSYFPDLNSSYLAWNRDRTEIKARLARLEKTLQILLARNRGDISWLYTDSIADTPAITLADFWKHRQADPTNMVMVPGAFTKKGRIKIEKFLTTAENASTSKEIIEGLRQGYLNSYPTQFVHWWKLFGNNFQDGELDLQTDSDWRETAILMAAPDNPYFQMMETMASELTAYAKDTGVVLPSWGKGIIAINDVRKLSLSSKKLKGTKSSLLSKATSAKDKIAAEALQGVDPSRAAAMSEQLKLAEAWGKYEDGLSGLGTITPYKEKAAKEFTSWFQQAAGSGQEQSVFSDVYDSWISLKTIAQQKYDSPFVWKIAYGPFAFLQDFAAKDTAQVLQEKWQEDVLSVAANVDPDKIPALLFAKESGIVWKYLQDYADPFVMKSVNGYKARTAYGRVLVFDPDFYSFLNQGTAAVVNFQPQYNVTLTTKPMEVSSKATVEPIYSIFSMQCSQKSFTLENDNFPRELSIDWSPEKCGAVTLKIGFPNMELSKKWSGSLAFAHFLNQFKKGSYRFVPTDFPEAGGHLQERQVDYIIISYLLSGEKKVLQLLNKTPDKVIAEIIVPHHQMSAKPHKLATSQPFPILTSTEQQRPEKKEVAAAEQAETPPPPTPRQDKKDEDVQHTAEAYHDGQWLLDQDPGKYTTQIMSLQSPKNIAKVFTTVSEKENNAVYSRVIKGTRWYILFSGLFPDSKAAVKYLESLPPALQKAGPVIRPLADIQEGIKQDAKDAGSKKAAPSDKPQKEKTSQKEQEKNH